MNAPRKICILSSGPLCRNPRTYKEARTLGRAGFDVTVLTVANIPRFERYDDEILRKAPFKKIALDLIGTRLSNFANRSFTRLARTAVSRGFESPQAFGPFYALRRKARAFAADLTIAHTEIALCIACDLAKRGRRVAADFEDWHSADLELRDRRGRPLRLLRRVERDLLHHAAYTSTTSGAMATALHTEFGGRMPVVFTNSFPLEPSPAHVPHHAVPAFFWFSQTIGPGRGLEEFLAAWALTSRPSRVCLLGDVTADYRDQLINALRPERRTRLEFLSLVAPGELPSVIARHDIGLALEPSAPPNRNLTITNKVLQYLNAGLPVIATATAGQREVLARAPGAGLIITLAETRQLSAKLDALLSDPARLAAMSLASRRAAEAIYCWELETPKLIAAVEGALAKVR